MEKELKKTGERVLVTHFGDPVKFVCSSFFDWNGKKNEAGRTLLQYVGTDKVRKRVPGFWAKFIAEILIIFNDEWDYVLIPDLRFPNEIEMLRDYGLDVQAIRVERPRASSDLTNHQKEHISETALDDYNFEHIIVNDGGLNDLKRQSVLFLNKLKWRG